MLTPEQEKQIRERAREVVVNDMYGDEDFMRLVAERFVADLDVAACVDTVASNDEDSQRAAFPDFDPETGKPWPDEDLDALIIAETREP